MSDKYPSLSPYAYCALNPVILVDPDGWEIFIHGDAADKATSVLSTKNIKITREEKDGKLSYTGKARTKDERKLVKAINSDKVTVNLTANNSNSMIMDDGTTTQSANGGAFLGNTIKDGKASTKQFVSMDLLNKNFDSHDVGKVVAHEITESFYGGLISLKKGTNALPAGGDGANNPIYLKAHRKASTQPYLKNEKKQILEEKKIQENIKPTEDRFAFPKYRTR